MKVRFGGSQRDTESVTPRQVGKEEETLSHLTHTSFIFFLPCISDTRDSKASTAAAAAASPVPKPALPYTKATLQNPALQAGS